MKKIALCALLLISTLSLRAQHSADAIFDRFSRELHAEKVKVGPLLMSVARASMDEQEPESEWARSITSIHVLSLEDCSWGVKERFNKEVSLMDTEGMELVMCASDEGDTVNVYLTLEDERVREILFAVQGESAALIRIKGNIERKDVARIVAENS